MLQTLLYLWTERRFLQPNNPLNTIPCRKIFLYWLLQFIGVAATVAISQTLAAIGFPILIIALIPLRTFLMPRWFTDHELNVLDNLTANNKCVLASLGGSPAKMTTTTGSDGDSSGEDKGSRSGQEESYVDLERAETSCVDHERCSVRSHSPHSELHHSRSATRQRVGSITRQTLHRPATREEREHENTGMVNVSDLNEEDSNIAREPAHRQHAASITR